MTGAPIAPGRRKALVALIAAVAGDATDGGLQVARERLDVLAPRGVTTDALAEFLARLAELHASQSLLDRPLAVVDLRLPDRLVVRPHPDPKPQALGRRT